MKKSYLHRWSSSRSTSGYRVWIAHPSRLGLTRGIPRLRMEGHPAQGVESSHTGSRYPCRERLMRWLPDHHHHFYYVLHNSHQKCT